MNRPRFVARYALVASLAGLLPVLPAGNAPSGSAPPNACGPIDAPYKVRIRITASDARRESLPEFRDTIKRTLCDPKSWVATGEMRIKFVRYGDLRIGLWTASETEERCMELIGLSVDHKYSCADSAQREVVINGRAWDNAGPGWPEDAGLLRYRRMLINHETGHALAQRHRDCPRDGAKAPVMMQQSKGMNLNGFTCEPNPWPLSSERRTLEPPSFYRV